MVALHNRKLTASDIWPDLLWTDADWHRKRDEVEAQCRAEGFVAHYLIFQISRRMEAYQRRFPSLKGRQKVMAAIYPAEKASGGLTDEEKEYMKILLLRANDPLAEQIFRKLV